ncbi:MAG: HNH endonuclease [Candidatus Eiseniibacteriota bacterium]
MRANALTHLSDAVLLRGLRALVARDRMTTAELLAYLAEVDDRRLYLAAGYSSMHAYCVDELHLSEDAALKRIQAARAARQFPVLFKALADGRLHLAGVRLLAPHLTAENLDELIEAATHRRRSEIEQFLVQRFPDQFKEPARPVLIRALPPAPTGPRLEQLAQGQGAIPLLEPVEHAPGHVEVVSRETMEIHAATLIVQKTDVSEEHAPGHVAPATPTAMPTEGRFLLRITIGQTTHDKLRYAQALLGHAVPSGDVEQVLERALDSLIGKLEKQKFGATSKPKTPRAAERRETTRRGSQPRTPAESVDEPPNQRPHVPSEVRREVWKRDQGRCTFVGETGQRCSARRSLEFDHVDPVARGGETTVTHMRLLCRAHNQFEAERAFGVEFMNGKRHAPHSRGNPNGNALNSQ